MFGFITKKREAANAQRETAEQAYARLIGKAITDGDLKPADADALWKAAEVLGKNAAAVETEITIRREHMADVETLKQQADATAVSNAIKPKLRDFDAETARLLRNLPIDRAAERLKLDEPRQKAIATITACGAARDRIQARLKLHWQMLGENDPVVVNAAAANRRRIVRHREGADVDSQPRAIIFEKVLAGRDDLCGDLDAYEYDLDADQSPDDLAFLLDVLRRYARGESREFAMCVAKADIEAARLPRMAAAYPFTHFIDSIESGEPPCPDGLTFIPYPGQSIREMEKMRERWERRFTREHPDWKPARAAGGAPVMA